MKATQSKSEIIKHFPNEQVTPHVTQTKLYHENLYTPAMELQAHLGLDPGLEHKTLPCARRYTLQERPMHPSPGSSFRHRTWSMTFSLWWQCLPALKFSVYHYKAVELGSGPL